MKSIFSSGEKTELEGTHIYRLNRERLVPGGGAIALSTSRSPTGLYYDGSSTLIGCFYGITGIDMTQTIPASTPSGVVHVRFNRDVSHAITEDISMKR